MVLALRAAGSRVRVTHAGDSINSEFVAGLPPATSRALEDMGRVRINLAATVVICHTEPGGCRFRAL
jgi:hypothetical protein